MIRFVIRATGAYVVAKLVVGLGEGIWRRYVRKINKKDNSGYYTNCIGFEVEPGEVYMDDSDKGEFVVRGFVVE